MNNDMETTTLAKVCYQAWLAKNGEYNDICSEQYDDIDDAHFYAQRNDCEDYIICTVEYDADGELVSEGCKEVFNAKNSELN